MRDQRSEVSLVTDRSFPVCARFDRFQVDLSRGELRKEGMSVAIQEQPLQVLRMLLQADGEVVTREQLCSALWPKDTFVDFEHGVNTAVKKLRQALEDSAERPRFVETLPRIGYRFMVPVEWTNGRSGISLLPSVVPIAPAETPPVLYQAPLETPPISPPIAAETPISPQAPPKGNWKLKTSIAVAALMVIPAVWWLLAENRYLSQARVGTWIGRVATRRSSEAEPVLRQRRLTANPHDAPLTSGVISMDGKYLAYSDPTGLYLRHVDSGETISVPLPKGFDAMPESWFPDGVHLVVSHFDDLEKKPPSLWEISIVGGTPRKLADAGLWARVSPDGSRIVFFRGKWNDEEIWLIDTDKNIATKIVDGGGDHFGPIAWAPDGRRFACVRMPDRFSTVGLGQRIEVFDATTGRGETILSDFRLGTAVAWPESGRLIYALQEAPPNDRNYNLWWSHLNSRTGRPYGSARITNDQNPIAGISVTGDGKRIALLRREFQTDVYLAELVAQGKLSALRRFTLDDRDDWPSAWTPDSKAVLFVSNRDGPNHIFRQSINATHPDLLVGGKDNLGHPHLTPDGLSALYLVFPSSGNATDNSRLMRVPLAGGSSELALEEPGIGGYRCARLPSTLCIYSRIDNGLQRFFTFDPAGGKVSELPAAKRPSDDGPGSAWSLSPDGKFLASPKSANPLEAAGLRVLDLTTSKEREILLPGLPLIMGMDWSPDSKSLWVGGYMGRSSGGTRSGLARVDLTGRVRTMLEGSSMAIWFAIPSPDGRRLAVMAHTDSSNVSLLENF